MKRIDFFLFFSVILLTLFGLFMIFNVSSVIAFRDFGDKYYYIKEQLAWTVLGFVALGFFIVFDYRKLYNLSLPILIGAIAALMMIFIPGLGITALGARRWINLGFVSIQPAEFVKLSLAIYLSAWFSTKEKGRFFAFVLLLGFVLLLILMQPDMKTATIILFEALVIYFISGGDLKYFMMSLPVIGVGGLFLILLAPYRLARLTSFMNVGPSLEGTSYHVKQILIALGSGGLLGVGIGNSMQKYAYLPENVTDSIFAIIAEEFGFIGSAFLIIILALIIWRGFYIAMRVKDPFGRFLATGIMSYIGIQMIINLAAMTALIPLTGVPLPFISYGGSALIIDLASIGIILNISKHMEGKKK